MGHRLELLVAQHLPLTFRVVAWLLLAGCVLEGLKLFTLAASQ